MVLRALLSALIIIAVGTTAASCGGSGGVKTTPDKTVGKPEPRGPGKLIFTRVDGIYEFDLESKKEQPLILQDSPNSFVLDPRVSPDGSKITYVVQPPAKVVDNQYDAGTDLWIANRDGSDRRMIYQHQQFNALVRFPAWEDADHVVAIIQEISEQSSVTQVSYTVQRVDVGSGERTKLLDDAFAFAISPDSERILYARALSPGIEVLEARPIAGGQIDTVVSQAENLQPMNSPRYSPDGKKIAFASADQTGARADRRLVSAHAAAESLDGLPEDIWVTDASGTGRPRRVADLKEDLPALAWSGDGEHLYVIGSGALYDVTLASGAVTNLGEGSFHAQIDWAP